jgi:hypothetical protein
MPMHVHFSDTSCCTCRSVCGVACRLLHSRIPEKAFLKALADQGVKPTRSQETTIVAFFSRAPVARRTVTGVNYRLFISTCKEVMVDEGGGGAKARSGAGGDGKMDESKGGKASLTPVGDKKVTAIPSDVAASVRQKFQRGNVTAAAAVAAAAAAVVVAAAAVTAVAVDRYRRVAVPKRVVTCVLRH